MSNHEAQCQSGDNQRNQRRDSKQEHHIGHVIGTRHIRIVLQCTMARGVGHCREQSVGALHHRRKYLCPHTHTTCILHRLSLLRLQLPIPTSVHGLLRHLAVHPRRERGRGPSHDAQVDVEQDREDHIVASARLHLPLGPIAHFRLISSGNGEGSVMGRDGVVLGRADAVVGVLVIVDVSRRGIIIVLRWMVHQHSLDDRRGCCLARVARVVIRLLRRHGCRIDGGGDGGYRRLRVWCCCSLGCSMFGVPTALRLFVAGLPAADRLSPTARNILGIQDMNLNKDH